MSQIDVCDSQTMELEARGSGQRADPLLGIVRLLDRVIAAWADRREQRRTMALLRKLGDGQLRDIGIDPAALYGERVGTIGEVHGDRFHGF